MGLFSRFCVRALRWTGLKRARAARGRWPPIKIVATSGLVDVGEKDLPERGRFLAKPYRPEHLAVVLCE
jgi:hypothetical protein